MHPQSKKIKKKSLLNLKIPSFQLQKVPLTQKNQSISSVQLQNPALNKKPSQQADNCVLIEDEEIIDTGAVFYTGYKSKDRVRLLIELAIVVENTLIEMKGVLVDTGFSGTLLIPKFIADSLKIKEKDTKKIMCRGPENSRFKVASFVKVSYPVIKMENKDRSRRIVFSKSLGEIFISEEKNYPSIGMLFLELFNLSVDSERKRIFAYAGRNRFFGNEREAYKYYKLEIKNKFNFEF